MTRTINAVYEGGILRPLQALEGIEEHSRVRVTLETMTPAVGILADCIGILPDEDAEEMRGIVADEFERVDPGEW